MKTIAMLAVLFTGASLLARDERGGQPTFRSNAELVVLHVSIRDRGGHYVADLPQEAFTVIDDGRPQQLTMFSAEDVPASIGFLVDNSNSMRPSRDRVVAASVAFAKSAHPQDEIFVLTFNEAVRAAFGPMEAAKIDPAAFARAMNQAIVARGMTAIYDGLAAGLSRLEQARHTRQVLIVVSDGDDNASHEQLDDVMRKVRESDATVYTIALIDPLVRGGDAGFLRRLARSTGGEAYEPRRVEDMPDAFDKIAKDIRSAYTLAWTPLNSGEQAADRRRHTVRVYVHAPDGRPLHVRARDGYFDNSRESRQ